MDGFVSEELKDVLKGITGISGCIEKLVRGRWSERWLTVYVSTASIHYYLSKTDQNNNKLRGIYPLTGGMVAESMAEEEEGGYYGFTVSIASAKKIRFRTRDKEETRTWCLIISHLATKVPEKQGEPIEGLLTVKSGMIWSKRAATLDTDLKILKLGKSVRESEGGKPAEEFALEGGAIRPIKSYGKTFEFELSATSSSNRRVELRLRAPTEAERVKWCQAIQGAFDDRLALPLSPSKGQEEGVVSVSASKRDGPRTSSESKEVVLKGLQVFSQKVMMRIGYYLRPHHIIHAGEVSKVYHTDLETVTTALLDAGFVLGSETSDEIVFELHVNPPVHLESMTTIGAIKDVLWPSHSSSRSTLLVPTSTIHNSNTLLLPQTLGKKTFTKSNQDIFTTQE